MGERGGNGGGAKSKAGTDGGKGAMVKHGTPGDKEVGIGA